MKLITMVLLAFVLSQPSTAYSGQIGDDGLHKQPWFSLTFKDIREDIAAAQEEGKRLALIVEQRGCIYCKRLHEKVFSDPKIAAYIAENYMVVQYNLYGDEEVIDLDGKTLTEKAAARRWGLLFSPTILFMPKSAPADGMAGNAAVARMPGAFEKGTVRHMFEWVREQGYLKGEPFQAYHARKLAAEAGK